MRKIILSITAVLTIIVANFTSSEAQRMKGSPAKTRDITIYVYQRTDEINEGGNWGKIVPFQRKIVDRDPLNKAFDLLLKGVNEKEQEKHKVENFIFDLKFIAARVRNKTAQINFKFIHEDIAEESWEGGGFDRYSFAKAVELTAKQFPGVERVTFCISGYKEYEFFGKSRSGKCSFPMFRRTSK